MENKDSLDLLNGWNTNEETPNFFSEVSEETTSVGYKEEIPNTLSGNESLANDLKSFNENRAQEMRDSLLETVFTNELTAFFQENKRMMNHAERNRTLHQLEKMIAKKQIYVNEIGQVVVRKGSNMTPSKKKKRKKK